MRVPECRELASHFEKTMKAAARILYVEDEPSLRLALSTILGQQGFEVFTAATVAEALSLITADRFDALISDLNIGQPGDGFTVVSAMRRVQPEAVTLILTGYPAFESALRAIREQVDDFLTKPADVKELVSSIKDKLQRPKRGPTLLSKRLPQIIVEHKAEIINDWYAQAETIPEIAAVKLSRQERLNNIEDVLEELVREGKHTDEAVVSNPALTSSAMHGLLRREQGYSIPMLLEESRVLHAVISDLIRRHLLEADISYLVPDMITIGDRLHRLGEESVRAYLRQDIKPEAA